MGLVGCSKPKPTPDSRAREWSLADGESISFSHEDPGPFGSDHYKYLDVRFKGGRTQRYAFEGDHSGYNEVVLYVDASQTKLWLIGRLTRERVFLDLSTGSFKDASISPPLANDASLVPTRGTASPSR